MLVSHSVAVRRRSEDRIEGTGLVPTEHLHRVAHDLATPPSGEQVNVCPLRLKLDARGPWYARSLRDGVNASGASEWIEHPSPTSDGGCERLDQFSGEHRRVVVRRGQGQPNRVKVVGVGHRRLA
jgi:hypothetical protein